MATIYNSISSNKRKTWILMTMFSVFAVLIVSLLGIYAGVDPVPSLIFGFIFAVTYSLISYYVADKVVLTISGAKAIEKRDNPELYRIVENLAIASGLPTPKIYIINDDSPNAFATGRDPKHASVAFTSGLLKIMNKQEVEGIAAHELSHIKNLDIRIMTIIVVLIGLIVLASDLIFRIGLYSNGNNRKGNSVVIILVGIALGILSPLVAQVIKLSISRTREYLADQSSVLMTRHPEGLASALTKIKNHSHGLKNASHATAHLYISNPFGTKKDGSVSWFNRLFMTHPPINDRIAKLRHFDQ